MTFHPASAPKCWPKRGRYEFAVLVGTSGAHARCGKPIAGYVEGLAKEDFLADKRTQQAVILNLIILGEAATKLMDLHPEVSAAHPEIEWRSMRGMRNRIAHGYYDIDLEVVWETVNSALPELVERLGS